ncbi:MAG TPA: hypothetical protein VLM38_05410 [Blastocatellia bacterium]|nr:hypothetical protein [Blastocatellia bacterium]
MADILNDEPGVYAADPQIQDQDPDTGVNGESANEFRSSLRSLNGLVRGHLGVPGYSSRTVIEFGAVGDGVTNDYQAFQEALVSFGDSGGILLIPPRIYRINVPDGLPLLIPPFVHVRGSGQQNTFLDFRIDPPLEGVETLTAAIRFMTGDNHGGITDLRIFESTPTPAGIGGTGIGLSFAGSQFNIATRLQIWDFAVGVDMSDGTSVFSAYNELSNFLVSRCPLGIRCYRHGNENWIERGRVFWAFGPPEESDGDGTGIGIDVDAAQALSIRSVAIESANTCFRFRATGENTSATCEMSGCYFEHGPPPTPEGEEPPPGPYRIFDVVYPSSAADPGGATYLRLGANHYEGTIGRLEVPAQALADLGALSESPFGAQTHFAAHAHRQLSENHDLRMYAAAFLPGEWTVHNSATLMEETADFFSGGRTLRVTRTAGPGDGIQKRIRVPEHAAWITVGFRYKNVPNEENLSSTSINYFARSGTTSVNGADTQAAGNEPSGSGYRERWLQLPRDPATDEVFATIEVDHGPQNGTSILVDAIWCVPGRVRTADFRYEQRVYYLERPQLVLNRTDVIANEQWSVDWAALTGLATAPRGAVGAILGVHLTATRNSDGQIVPRPISVTVAAAAGATIYAERDGRVSARQVAVRSPSSEPTAIHGVFRTELGASFPTDYQIFIAGWILG